MKKIIFFLNVLLNISLITAGFTSETLVQTPKGLVQLQSLKIGDMVICYKGNGLLSEKPIHSIQCRKVDEIFKIITRRDDIIYSSKDARFLMPKNGQWNYACDLRPGNWLLQQNMEGVEIKEIEKLVSSTDIFDIGVNTYHNFGVSKNGIIVHNMSQAALASAKLVLQRLGIYPTQTVDQIMHDIAVEWAKKYGPTSDLPVKDIPVLVSPQQLENSSTNNQTLPNQSIVAPVATTGREVVQPTSVFEQTTNGVEQSKIITGVKEPIANPDVYKSVVHATTEGQTNNSNFKSIDIEGINQDQRNYAWRTSGYENPKIARDAFSQRRSIGSQRSYYEIRAESQRLVEAYQKQLAEEELHKASTYNMVGSTGNRDCLVVSDEDIRAGGLVKVDESSRGGISRQFYVQDGKGNLYAERPVAPDLSKTQQGSFGISGDQKLKIDNFSSNITINTSTNVLHEVKTKIETGLQFKDIQNTSSNLNDVLKRRMNVLLRHLVGEERVNEGSGQFLLNSKKHSCQGW